MEFLQTKINFNDVVFTKKNFNDGVFTKKNSTVTMEFLQ
jgi:hypothetical protein